MRTTITRAGKFRVDEPSTIARVDSMLAPLLRKALEIGTIHAEHKVIGVPTSSPLSAPFKPPLENSLPREEGNRKASVRPATRKAKAMPMVTSLREVMEKVHQRVRRVDSLVS